MSDDTMAQQGDTAAPEASADPSLLGGSEPSAPSTPPEETPPAKTEGEVKTQIPEVYEFKFPEGISKDEPMLGEFADVAKEMGLTNDQAQKLVDLYTKKVQGSAKTYAETIEGWRAEVQKDPQFADTIALAKKAKALGDPEFQSLMDAPGWGDHPAVIKFLAKVGRMVSEDKFVEGGASRGERSLEDILYPTMKK